MPGAKLWSSRTPPTRAARARATRHRGERRRRGRPERLARSLSCGDLRNAPCARAWRSSTRLTPLRSLHPRFVESVGPGERRAGRAHLIEVSSSRRAMCRAWGMLIHLSKTSTRGSRRLSRPARWRARDGRSVSRRSVHFRRRGGGTTGVVFRSFPRARRLLTHRACRSRCVVRLRSNARTSGAPDRFRPTRVNGPLLRPGCAFRR